MLVKLRRPDIISLLYKISKIYLVGYVTTAWFQELQKEYCSESAKVIQSLCFTFGRKYLKQFANVNVTLLRLRLKDHRTVCANERV